MITVYWANANDLLQDTNLDDHVAGMPKAIQAKIMSYADRNERAVRIVCKLMLNKFSQERGLDKEICLDQLHYTKEGKPYFPNTSFNFSSTHTGSMVLCAALQYGRIGIDAEQLKPVPVNDLSEHFTVSEWDVICHATDTNKALLHLWSRKEAVLKADGQGLFGPLEAVEAIADEVAFNGKVYYLHNIELNPDYVVHLATNEQNAGIEISEFRISS